MTNKTTQYIAFATTTCGSMTILLGMIMLFTFPSSANLTDGFKTPIIAFEFAKNEADLKFLSGTSEVSQANREKMNQGHIWDMFFPVAYSGFLALLMVKLVRSGCKFLKLGILIAITIIPFDIHENLILLQITDQLDQATPLGPLITELQIATWLKWGAIGLSFALLALGYAVKKYYFSAVTAFLASLGIVLCWFSNAEPIMAEAMSLMTFLFFIGFTIKEFSNTYQLIRVDNTF